MIVNEGYLVQIVARLPRPSLCSLRAFNHHVASQVHDTADRTKILNTGTNWPNPTTGFAAHTNIAFESRTGGITVSSPGKAWIGVRDPRPLRPPARKRRIETQATRSQFTFECYDTPVTVNKLGSFNCVG